MENSFLGVFRAIVTDVDCFKETGRIKTKISVLNDNYLVKNLMDNFNPTRFEEEVEKDLYTKIFMPFGGGYNYGMFKLPPINSYGLVAFIDGNPLDPVWLGGISTADYTETGVFATTNIPSDDPFSDRSAITFNEEKNETEFNTKDMNSFIIKTKNNSLDLSEGTESMNWENRKVENSIILNESEMDFTHFGKKSNQRIVLTEEEEDDTETYSVSITDNRNTGEKAKMELGMPGVNIEIENKEIISKINITDTGINIVFKKGEKETLITQTENKIKLESNRSSVSVKTEGAFDEVVIDSPIVRISSDKIIMGNTDYRLVVAPNNFNLTMEDGTMLTTAKNVRI